MKLARTAGTVFDLVSGAEVTSVAIGGEPDAIWFNAPRQRLYVAIGRSGHVDVVDCRRLVVVEQLVADTLLLDHWPSVHAHLGAYDRQVAVKR